MTQTEAKKLPNGLYKIYWKEGGYSLGAMGRTYNGMCWIAPCNWISSDNYNPQIATTQSWVKVERMELIIPTSNYGSPDTESL